MREKRRTRVRGAQHQTSPTACPCVPASVEEDSVPIPHIVPAADCGRRWRRLAREVRRDDGGVGRER